MSNSTLESNALRGCGVWYVVSAVAARGFPGNWAVIHLSLAIFYSEIRTLGDPQGGPANITSSGPTVNIGHRPSCAHLPPNRGSVLVEITTSFLPNLVGGDQQIAHAEVPTRNVRQGRFVDLLLPALQLH